MASHMPEEIMFASLLSKFHAVFGERGAGRKHR